jgi:hypothetical protein
MAKKKTIQQSNSFEKILSQEINCGLSGEWNPCDSNIHYCGQKSPQMDSNESSLIMEAVSTCDTSVSFYQITRPQHPRRQRSSDESSLHPHAIYPILNLIHTNPLHLGLGLPSGLFPWDFQSILLFTFPHTASGTTKLIRSEWDMNVSL